MFDYDALNRLVSSETFINNASTRVLSTDYDALGNIAYKTSSAGSDVDVTGYSYTPGSNRLGSVVIGGVNHTLHYNANGAIEHYDRQAAGDDRYISWNARNLPASVVLGSSQNDPTPTAKDEFAYGPDGARYYKRSTWDDAGTENVEHTFYVGAFEELITDASDTATSAIEKRGGRVSLDSETRFYKWIQAYRLSSQGQRLR